jgi:antirestriction protein
MRDISHTDDVIDSRDVIERIAELSDLREEDGQLDEDDAEELATLLDLASEGENSAADWQFGATLIHDDYFEEYARQLADDIGAVDSDAGWPTSYIDWTAAAEALKMDYSSVEFDGETYWVRS